MKQIPNLFTLLNLVFGSVAVICILQNGIAIVYGVDTQNLVSIPERIWLASLFIALAALADFLDGFVARLFRATSALGRELDSLSDVVSFGLAPGLILYQLLRMSYMQQEDGADTSIFLLLPALLVPCAAAYRLARFNLDTSQQYGFKGIPVPAVGLVVASFPLIYWTAGEQFVSLLLNRWLLYAVILLLSWGMVSRMPMLALKFKSLSPAANLPVLLLLGAAVIAFVFLHWLAVPVVFLFYIVLSLAFKNRTA